MSLSVRIGLVLVVASLVWQCSEKPTAPNRSPDLVPIGAQSVQEGARLEFMVQATDPDGTSPALSARNLPTNASVVDSGNGTMLFTFEPDYTQFGTYAVTFIASDGQLADSEAVTITVIDAANHPPVLATIGNAWVHVNGPLYIWISATDPDGAILSYRVINEPENSQILTYSDGTAEFLFTPDITQIGVHTPIFVASDGEMADSEVVTIAVLADEKSIGDLWPMAVGNYWVYEVTRSWDSTYLKIDSVHVQSGFQSNGRAQWHLYGGAALTYLGENITIRNDSIIYYLHNVAIPPVWPERTETVPAGIFNPTYEDCMIYGHYPFYAECLVFAKGVGIIKVKDDSEWGNIIYRSESRLVRYYVK